MCTNHGHVSGLMVLCLYTFVKVQSTEAGSWLMFYSLSVLKGILPNPYLTHFSLLVSGLWLLSSDHITQEDLRLAREYLHKFYKKFGDLYGA